MLLLSAMEDQNASSLCDGRNEMNSSAELFSASPRPLVRIAADVVMWERSLLPGSSHEASFCSYHHEGQFERARAARAQGVQPPAAPAVTAAFDPATLPDQKVGQKITGQNRRFASARKDRTGSFQPLHGRAVFGIRSRACQTDLPVTAFATGLEHPRRLLVLPNGDVILAEQSKGHLHYCVTKTATAKLTGFSGMPRA